MKKILELAINKVFDINLLKFIDRCSSIFNSLVDDVTFKPWVALELFNGWVNYSSNRTEASCTKNNQGIVYIKGMIKNGTITSGTVAARLPTGYAPDRIHSFLIIDNAGANTGRVDIHPNGEIKVQLLSSGTTWICLDGVTYLL